MRKHETHKAWGHLSVCAEVPMCAGTSVGSFAPCVGHLSGQKLCHKECREAVRLGRSRRLPRGSLRYIRGSSIAQLRDNIMNRDIAPLSSSSLSWRTSTRTRTRSNIICCLSDQEEQHRKNRNIVRWTSPSSEHGSRSSPTKATCHRVHARDITCLPEILLEEELTKVYGWMLISGFKCNHIQVTEEGLQGARRRRNKAPGLDARTLKMLKEW